MKDIEYVCYKCDDRLGQTRKTFVKSFKKVEDAIEFLADKKDGCYYWYEIKVEWD